MDLYTLKNHGKNRNCSLMAMYPSKIDVVSLEVGNNKKGIVHMVSQRRAHTKTVTKISDKE